MQKHLTKSHRDFLTKLGYHEYLKNGLYNIMKEKMPDIEFIKEYPQNEPSRIDIVGVRKILGKTKEIIAVEVLGIAEETTEKHRTIRSGQLEKIMHDIAKLLLRSSAPVKALVFSTTYVRDYMRKLKERNLMSGYVNWEQIDFYEANEFAESL